MTTQGGYQIGLPLGSPDKGTDKGLTGDLADVLPKASNREPAGGLYSIDFSEGNMDGPPSEVTTVVEGGGFIVAFLGDGDMTPKESELGNGCGWVKKEPCSQKLVPKSTRVPQSLTNGGGGRFGVCIAVGCGRRTTIAFLLLLFALH